ncbi:SPFH domain-containing protein [Paraliomyxa miuraensis]|uniref:SPFH domain-containing protein n=1 Tax=Paraliomyxa miuraensis TaxID=376150 RepID=UPI00225A04DA|nr:SPFH domain-containing protein [Paraliomyxa miuraensis]MCX4241763.1 SPFH domain-containing protein [Paraliomyxa miuraensis]
MPYRNDEVKDLQVAPKWELVPTHEEAYGGFRLPGVLMLLFSLPLLFFFGIGILFMRGLVLVEPNESKAVLLFGKYKGTIRTAGFHWINPFTTRRHVSLRARNFDSTKLKVNDQRGNPIEIGAVVVWRVKDTAQALFDVDHYESYVAVQTESAIRTTAAKHPYDAASDGEVSLRGDSAEVNAELMAQLTERLSHAGVEILEVRLSHLAYAPEIAGVMLRRQQAEAIIDARQRIVEGAVSMVKMALDDLRDKDVVHLDGSQTATLASNLLVVLCSESDAQPVVSTGA